METIAIVGAITAAAGAMAQGVQASSGANAQAQEARYNAQVLQQQGQAESASAAANEAGTIQKGNAQLGEQAAAAGQAGIGTGGTIGGVERQSATNARMDALNVWYGGELQHYQASNAAAEQSYNAKIESSNSSTDLLTGGINALGSGAKSLLIPGIYGNGIYGNGGFGGVGGGGMGGLL